MSKKQGLSFYHKKKKISSTALREIAEWFFLVFTAILIATVLVFSIGMRTSVIGVSMEPGLYNGQEILINHFLYKIVSPKRGDVIVFLPNGNQNTHYYVKRVVGLPGETVQIKDERLYINGVLAEEDEGYDKMADAGITENEITLGSDTLCWGITGITVRTAGPAISVPSSGIILSEKRGSTWLPPAMAWALSNKISTAICSVRAGKDRI